MDEIEKLMADLEKVAGAGELIKKLRPLVKEMDTERDSARGAEAAAKKEAQAAKKAAEASKRDLDAGAGAKDEALKAAHKERDDWKAKAEDAEKRSLAARRRSAVADALDIADATRRSMAVDAILPHLPEDEVTLDENDKLKGAAKHIDAFKKKASFFWSPADDAEAAAAAKGDKGNGGPRNGGDKTPLGNSGPGAKPDATRADKIQSWDKALFNEPAASQKAAAK